MQKQFLRRKTCFGLRIDSYCLCRNSQYIHYTILRCSRQIHQTLFTESTILLSSNILHSNSTETKYKKTHQNSLGLSFQLLTNLYLIKNKPLIHKLRSDDISRGAKSEVRYERAAEEKPHKETEV